MITSIKTVIAIKKKKFKCTLKIKHDRQTVDLSKSAIKCTPGKPKKQKAKNVIVDGNGYVFRIDVEINPSSISKAVITSAPTTTPFPTTTPTTFIRPSTGSSGNCTCGQARRGQRIVNGEETDINEYPWMAGLVHPGGDSVWCGATLISDIWLLTAAHCTKNMNPGDIEVLLGDHNLWEDSEAVSLRSQLAAIIDHPKYDSSTVNYDFSLLKLGTKLDFSLYPHIRPICLPLDLSEDYDGFLATVSGWGTTSSGGSLSNYLQEANVNVMSNEECNSDEYAYNGAVTNQMLCANVEGGGTDSCQGDSGIIVRFRYKDYFKLLKGDHLSHQTQISMN